MLDVSNRLQTPHRFFRSFSVLRSLLAIIKKLLWRERLKEHPMLMALLPVALMAALCGIWVDARGLAILVALGMIITMGVVWPWLAMRFVQGALSFEATRIREGESVGARLALRNRSPLPIWGLSLRSEVKLPHTFGVIDLGGWANREYKLTIHPMRRGEYQSETFALGTGFPFGLLEAKHSLVKGRSFIVWPRTVAVAGVPDVGAGRLAEGSLPSQQTGNSGDIGGTRPYQRGDSIRQIHWRQTARHDQLIVFERQSTRRITGQILIDLDPSVHSRSNTDMATLLSMPIESQEDTSAPGLATEQAWSTREWAIRIAASLYATWSTQGVTLALYYSDAPEKASCSSGEVATVFDALARIGDSGDSLASLEKYVRHHAGNHDSLRVVITTGKALRAMGQIHEDDQTLYIVLNPDSEEGFTYPPRAIHIIDMEEAEIVTRLQEGWRL